MDGPNGWVCNEESRRSRSSAHISRKRNIEVCNQIQFAVTNNEAEYEALLTGLSLAKALGAKNLFVQADSQLIIG